MSESFLNATEGSTVSLERRKFSDTEIEEMATLWIALVYAQGKKFEHPPRHGFSPKKKKDKT